MEKLKSIVVLFFYILIGQIASAQTAEQLHETAKTFMRQGDYSNAILVLTKSGEKSPADMSIQKDLALSYFYTQNNQKALEIITPVLDSKDADDQCFLITGNIYRQLEKVKDCERIYKKGLKLFSESGLLYNELGEVQVATLNYSDAIKNWEKGIKFDPSYSKNYYNASRYYSYNKNIVWALFYGEIFVNMEPRGGKTAEIKQMILDNYKALFIQSNIEKSNKEKNKFSQKYLSVLNKQFNQASYGINAESLSMIRSRFILDWFADASNPTVRLFDFQKQLLKEGLFEAYNQWLFGATENVNAYQNWIKANAADNNNFLKIQSTTIFKIPVGQYYH